MAESKITHAGGLKLPEPKWLTLDVLAERWTRMSGTPYDTSHLLELATDMQLQISIFCPLVIPHVIFPSAGATETRHCAKAGIPQSGVFGVSRFDIERLLAGEVFAPDSVMPNSVLRVFGISAHDIARLLAGEGDAVPPNSALTPDSEISNAVFVPTAENTLKVENLIVTREEIERFELRHGVSEPVPTSTAPDAAPENRPWEAMTPEQSRAHASARYAVLGKFSLVGRELGISGKRVSQLVQEHREGASKKREGASMGAELLNMTPPTKQGKSRG